MILVDFSQIMYANIFAESRGSAITDESLLRHMIYNSLRKIKSDFGREYGRMLLCFDSGNCWRNDYFAHYKAARKVKRAEEPEEDMKTMFEFINRIQSDLEAYSPYVCMRVPRCEADDIIAVLCRKRIESKKTPFADESILIISNDSDYYQLHDDRISQYLSRKKKIVCSDSPEEDLLSKIVSGDKGDGIPNVLSDDDTFVVEGKRQTQLRKAKAATIIDEITADSPVNFLKTTGIVTQKIQENWDRNERLIDLYCIPPELQDQIIEEYNAIAPSKYSNKNRGIDFYKYMITHDMKIMAEETQTLMIGE